MVEFLDGPASGTVLQLRRAPMMLRVVIDQRGNIDALDQLMDTPKPQERVVVYIQVGPQPSFVHVCARGRDGRRTGGWYASATYRVLPDQPADEHVREIAAWVKWVNANRQQLDQIREGLSA